MIDLPNFTNWTTVPVYGHEGMTRPVSTHNGMNLTRSVKNPNSRLSKIVSYLRENGETSRRNVNIHSLGMSPNHHGRGWGIYVWTLGRKNGILNYNVKTRKWSVND